MKTLRKIQVYNAIRVVNQVFFSCIVLALIALIVNYIARANEDVADYNSLKISPTTVTAGSEVTYTFSWTKKVAASGDLYRSWLRMKPQGSKFVRDTRYVPTLISGSFRVGRDQGTYTNSSNIKAPDTPGFYVFQIRGEYQRVVGADPSVDVKESNVVEVKAADKPDTQSQIESLTEQLNELSTKATMSSQSAAKPQASPSAAVSPSPIASPAPANTPSSAPQATAAASPSSTQRRCVLGLLGLCILGVQ